VPKISLPPINSRKTLLPISNFIGPPIVPVPEHGDISLSPTTTCLDNLPVLFKKFILCIWLASQANINPLFLASQRPDRRSSKEITSLMDPSHSTYGRENYASLEDNAFEPLENLFDISDDAPTTFPSLQQHAAHDVLHQLGETYTPGPPGGACLSTIQGPSGHESTTAMEPGKITRISYSCFWRRLTRSPSPYG
jgi:hypothetical protein